MIIVRLYGGTGNQMFQYALGRAIALKSNTTVGLDLHDLLDRTPRANFTFREYQLDLFNIHAQILDQSSIPLRYRSLVQGKITLKLRALRRKLFGGKGKEKGTTIDLDILDRGPDLYLDGYWQSHKYIESIRNILIQDFSLRNPLPIHIKELKDKIENSNAMCLHVRRGDYVGNSFHETVFSEYYEQALSIVSTKTSIEHIYVFSDDIEWCRNNLQFAYPTTFVGDEYKGERDSGHFDLMKTCSHFIIPNSSFSWWAAWLSTGKDKVVIAPKKWFADSSIDTSHRIPQDWIRI